MTSVSSASSLSGSFRDPSFRLSLASIHSLHSLIDSYALADDQWEATQQSKYGEECQERNLNKNWRIQARGISTLATESALFDTLRWEARTTSQLVQNLGTEQLSTLESNVLCSSQLSQPREGTSRALECNISNVERNSSATSGAEQCSAEQQQTPILSGRSAGRIRVTKDQWRKDKRLDSAIAMSIAPRVNRKRHETIRDPTQSTSCSSDVTPMCSTEASPSALLVSSTKDAVIDRRSNISRSKAPNAIEIAETSVAAAINATEAASLAAAEATDQALRLVRLAELDRQRVLYRSQPPPKDEYNTIEEDIPPYRAQLHRYLDLVSYDERFTPILRVNRYLINTDTELTTAINKFSKFNLLPETTNLWAISHVDDNEYENMIPTLIPETSYYLNDLMA